LTVLGRLLLTVIDQEHELLQIAARTPAGLSTRLDTALPRRCHHFAGDFSLGAGPDQHGTHLFPFQYQPGPQP
jgi:hypothetical protein